MPAWPAALPQTLLVEGFEEQAPENVLRTAMSAGPVKQRRRFTAAPRPVSGSVIVTKVQLNTVFKPWLRDQVYDGALAFDWKDPTTGTAASLRLAAPPRYGVVGGDPDKWSINMNLEVLP